MPNNSSQYLLILLNKRMSSIPTQIWTCWCLIWSWFLSLFQLYKLSVCIVACIKHDARPCLFLTEGSSGWMDTGVWCRRSLVSSHVPWFNCFKCWKPMSCFDTPTFWSEMIVFCIHRTAKWTTKCRKETEWNLIHCCCCGHQLHMLTCILMWQTAQTKRFYPSNSSIQIQGDDITISAYTITQWWSFLFHHRTWFLLEY